MNREPLDKKIAELVYGYFENDVLVSRVELGLLNQRLRRYCKPVELTREQRIEKAARELVDCYSAAYLGPSDFIQQLRDALGTPAAPPAPSEPTEEEMRRVVGAAGWYAIGSSLEPWTKGPTGFHSLKEAYERVMRERGGK